MYSYRFETVVGGLPVNLMIPIEVVDGSGVGRIAVISYKAESALTQAFDAQEMATISFFQARKTHLSCLMNLAEKKLLKANHQMGLSCFSGLWRKSLG